MRVHFGYPFMHNGSRNKSLKDHASTQPDRLGISVDGNP